MKVKLKIALGVFFLGAISLSLGIIGSITAKILSTDYDEILAEEVPIANVALDTNIDILMLRRYEKDMFLNLANSEKHGEYFKKFKEQLLKLDSAGF